MSNFLRKAFAPLSGSGVPVVLALVAALALAACSNPAESPGVDKNALNAKIGDAEAKKGGVVIASTASEVPEEKYWVSASVLSTFNAAINAAEAVAARPGATQADVDVAAAALTAAILAFEGAKQPGSGTGLPPEVDKTALNTAIAAAKIAKAGVVISANGSGLSKGTVWVTAGVMTAFNNAIEAAEIIKLTYSATAAEVSDAVDDLKEAAETFDAAKKTATGGGGSNNTTPDLLPGNWKTLNYAGWETWLRGIDESTVSDEDAEALFSFIEDHWDELTQGGQQFWEEMIGDDESPAEHRGTWKKGNITLVISSNQITISGATWGVANGTFQIGNVKSKPDAWYRYYCYREPKGEDNDFGIYCKLNGNQLVMGNAPFDDGDDGLNALHGTWTKVGGGNDGNNPFVGTWSIQINGQSGTLTMTDSTWELPGDKGTYTRNGTTATLIRTHGKNGGGSWEEMPGMPFTATVSGNTLTIDLDDEGSLTFTKQ
jgi:hypothetical protein